MTAAEGDASVRRDALRRLRSSLAVLAMVAAGKPDEVLDRLPLLLKVCHGAGLPRCLPLAVPFSATISLYTASRHKGLLH